MANQIPFVAYFKVVPERGTGKRFEIHRSRERIAHLVWNDLNNVLENAIVNFDTGSANFAVPGGTIHWGLAADAHSNASTMNAVAFKPQFGEEPETLTVVGFYDDDNLVPYDERTIISGGRTWRGPAGTKGYHPDVEPNTANRAAAFALRQVLESAITSVPVELIKLEINGAVYGRGAIHFPREGTG